MSKSKGKMKAAPQSGTKRTRTVAQRRAAKNVAKNSTILFWFTAILLLALFLGRWVVAIANGYEGSFVEVDASAATAVSNMRGLTPGSEEQAAMLPLQKAWDLFTSSRLRDEVTMTADDGAVLHAYLYDEGSDVTVVVLPRFYQDGTADFLPGTALYDLTGCNILMPDPRCHGKSGGEYFTYGLTERYDLAAWLSWAEAELGSQTFILWGEGTGANTALLAEASGLLPESVAFIVAESPYASPHELAKASIWKWYTVPSVPFLFAIETKISMTAGFRVKDIDLPSALSEGAGDIPVLFLRSEYDSYILPAWSEAVEAAYTGSQASVVGGGSHGTVYASEQAQIDTLLARWWEQYGA